MTCLAAKGFMRIDGTHWARSFAYNAFFSLFPLIILFVTLASFFVDRESAGRAIVTYLEGYVPLDGEMRARIFGVIAGVIQARERAGLVALPFLVWAALQCFTTLVRVTNRAWGDKAYSWWRLPLRAMVLVGITAGAVLLGMAAPALASVGKTWLISADDSGSWVYALWGFVVPLLVLFFSLAFFLPIGSGPEDTIRRSLGRRRLRHGAPAGDRDAIRRLPQTLFSAERRLRGIRRDHGAAAVDLPVRLRVHLRGLSVRGSG